MVWLIVDFISGISGHHNVVLTGKILEITGQCEPTDGHGFVPAGNDLVQEH